MNMWSHTEGIDFLRKNVPKDVYYKYVYRCEMNVAEETRDTTGNIINDMVQFLTLFFKNLETHIYSGVPYQIKELTDKVGSKIIVNTNAFPSSWELLPPANHRRVEIVSMSPHHPYINVLVPDSSGLPGLREIHIRDTRVDKDAMFEEFLNRICDHLKLLMRKKKMTYNRSIS
jgi:hypothetical protein